MKDQGGDGGAEGAPRCRNLGQPQPADDSGAHGPHRRKGKPDGRGAKAFARRGIARQGRSSDTVPALEVKDVRRLGNERGMGGGRKEPPGTRTQDREGGGLRRRMWGLRSPGRGAEVAPRRRIPPAPPEEADGSFKACRCRENDEFPSGSGLRAAQGLGNRRKGIASCTPVFDGDGPPYTKSFAAHCMDVAGERSKTRLSTRSLKTGEPMAAATGRGLRRTWTPQKIRVSRMAVERKLSRDAA